VSQRPVRKWLCARKGTLGGFPTWAIRAAKNKIPNLDFLGPLYESLYVNPKESKGFTSG